MFRDEWAQRETYVQGFRGGGQEGHSNGSKESIRKMTTAMDRQTDRQRGSSMAEVFRPQIHSRDTGQKWGLFVHLPEDGVASQGKGKERGMGCIATNAPLDRAHFSEERSWP